MTFIHVLHLICVVIVHALIICVAETAENIGYSCNLLREEMNEVFVISGNSPEDVRQELRSDEVFKKVF